MPSLLLIGVLSPTDDPVALESELVDVDLLIRQQRVLEGSRLFYY